MEYFDNLFNPDQQNYDEETLPLDQIMKIAIESRLLEMHVCLPGTVTAIGTNGYISVQPTLQIRYTNLLSQQTPGTFTNSILSKLPVIQGVPVLIPSGQDWWIKAPVAVGDVGIILFSERSLDRWKVTSGQAFVDPQDSRKFDMSDAIFVPGIRTMAAPIPGAATDLVVHNGGVEIQLKKAGKAKLKNDANSLGGILSSLDSALTTFATGLNPISLPAQAAALVVALAAIQLQIDSLLE